MADEHDEKNERRDALARGKWLNWPANGPFPPSGLAVVRIARSACTICHDANISEKSLEIDNSDGEYETASICMKCLRAVCAHNPPSEGETGHT